MERILEVLASQIKEKEEFLWKDSIKFKSKEYGYMEIDYNDYIGIVGESGAGKTTLINYILAKQMDDDVCVYYDESSVDKLFSIRIFMQV